MKCKDKLRKDNLTQKLKQLKKHREKFEEQQEKQGCYYPYHRKAKKAKADVSVNASVAVNTTANVANPAIRTDLNFDVKSSQAVAEAEQLSAKIATVINTPDSKFASDATAIDMTQVDTVKANTAPTAIISKFSKFVDVSKERPDKRFHRLEIWFADLGYHDWR